MVYLPHDLVVRYTQLNKYSFAALIGALQQSTINRMPSIQLVTKFSNCSPIIDKIHGTDHHPVLAYSFFSTQAPQVYHEIQTLKKQYGTKVTIIAGGPHPSARPHETLANGVDYVIQGEGEIGFPKLIQTLDSNDPHFDAIPGLFWQNLEGTVQQNPRGPPINLDDYPPFAPDFPLFSPFEISRGCPGACKYCQVTPLFGGHMRHRSVSAIIGAAKIAVKMRYDRLWLLSPNSFAYGSKDGCTPNPNAVQELLEELTAISGLNEIYFGTFPSEVRPDSVTVELLKLVKQYAANTSIIVGAQTGSDRLLQSMGRCHTSEQVRSAADLISEQGLTADFDFIFGLPDESPDDQKQSRDLITYLIDKGHRIHGHTFMPLPGTVYENAALGKIDRLTQRLLGNLSQQQKAYGSWGHQEVVARRLKGESVKLSWEHNNQEQQ